MNNHGDLIGQVSYIAAEPVYAPASYGWTRTHELVPLSPALANGINDAGLTVGIRGNRAVSIDWL